MYNLNLGSMDLDIIYIYVVRSVCGVTFAV